jgi:ribosomal-protein-alanine acetyltransferase
MINLEIHTPGAAHWSRQQYEHLFAAKTQIQPERFAWIAEDEPEERPDKVPDEKPELLAFLVGHRIDAEWELENMVVAATVRRRGIGTVLLRDLIAQVRAKNGKSVFLEVRESNQGARALYRKAGFEAVGLRKSYYLNPSEDAILYRFSLDFS